MRWILYTVRRSFHCTAMNAVQCTLYGALFTVLHWILYTLRHSFHCTAINTVQSILHGTKYIEVHLALYLQSYIVLHWSLNNAFFTLHFTLFTVRRCFHITQYCLHFTALTTLYYTFNTVLHCPLCTWISLPDSFKVEILKMYRVCPIIRIFWWRSIYIVYIRDT